jgi:hypothetical protein
MSFPFNFLFSYFGIYGKTASLFPDVFISIIKLHPAMNLRAFRLYALTNGYNLIISMSGVYILKKL